ncbi:phosphoenolpyruvate--protein phosphotransferase [Bremerella sp. T1]|uniref:phosphoenolpyruvate--protein phosphotransferase n=1 Tax=Bremerella sp. TYQ1 TaxID=3119568 RepID=UPI001CCD12B4|nr:phosphoenolpyruvate--protein phosphotransferase [Bremerella volcania]UBM34941.1 phosphoenolpyruvate--protein phosphotransferase [Bremerella volcania]
MRVLQGIAVSAGVAIAKAMVVDDQQPRVTRRFISRANVDSELQRLSDAMDMVADQIQVSQDEVATELGDQYGAIFSAHLQMVRDEKLNESLVDSIRYRHYTAEYAVSQSFARYIQFFERVPNPFLRERAGDFRDIEQRLLNVLFGADAKRKLAAKQPSIVIAHDLTPSEMANLDRVNIRGIVTEVGGPGSHSAIVAEALELPAVVGIGSHLREIQTDTTLIIDGHQGRVIVQPDDETVARYKKEVEQQKQAKIRLRGLKDLPAVTVDDETITLMANIEFPHEADACIERGASGVGLYRTEFLYLGQDSEPTEEDHYQVYSKVIRDMQGSPIVIRTLDLGADKIFGDDHPPEQNPFLGLRSIRLSLRNTDQFRRQLRAILRASVLGDVSVMFPLVSTLHELRQAKMLLSDLMEDLEEQSIAFNRDLKVGIMVEVPSSVVMLDRFAQEIDFISIGTNDLVQYTLAVDRNNPDVAALYNSCDPAVLRLIQMAVDSAIKAGIDVTLCGQMGGNPVYTMLLIGMGLRSLSVTPSAIPEIKQICRTVSAEKCRELAVRVRDMDNAWEIKRLLREHLRQLFPDES